MRRKIVKQGSSTLMVSIPSKWASKFKLKKGDELEIDEKERHLVISTEKEFKNNEIEVNIDNLSPMVLRVIASLYKSGYDKVKITYSESKMINDIQNALKNEISGFEIIEQTKNYCILKKIEEGVSEGFDPILRRTFMLLLTMAEESGQAIKKNDFESLKQLRFLEEVNNRLTTYLRRNLSKYGYNKHNKIQFIYFIIEELERIADQYKYLFDYLLEKPKLQISKETFDYYSEINLMIRNYYELFYKFDKKLIAKIGNQRKILTKDLNKSLEKGSSDAVIMHYLITIMNIVFEMIEPYLSLEL